MAATAEPRGDPRPRVIVTRPSHQGGPFCAALSALGLRVVRFPTLAILPPPRPAAAHAALGAAGDAAAVIFTSANAVSGADRLRPLAALIPAAVPVLAIGPATAAALARAGLSASTPAAGRDSEALLAEPLLRAIDGRSLLLVSGEGGRRLLERTLQARGARLITARVYRRALPARGADAAHLFHTESPQILSLGSDESLANLVTLTPSTARQMLLRSPLVVNGPRARDCARQRGFVGDILCAEPPGDDGQLRALGAWMQRQAQR